MNIKQLKACRNIINSHAGKIKSRATVKNIDSSIYIGITTATSAHAAYVVSESGKVERV